MARARFIPVLESATGLCNTKSSARLEYDLKTGASQLPVAVNINIDRTGEISRCTGYTSKSAAASHSAWSDGEQCFFVSGATLYRLHQDYSTTTVRTGMVSDKRVSYASVGPRVYYTNGDVCGFITGTKDNEWVKGTYAGPTSGVEFADPPVGHLTAFAFGRMLMAVGSAIFASEPSFYGRFNLAKFRAEKSRITMLLPVLGGLFVGTEREVAFYRGDKWEETKRKVLMSAGALEGSEAKCRPEVLDLEQDDEVFIFTTSKGICLAGDGGMFRNLTENDLVLPSARRASGAILNDRYVVHIAP